MIRDLTKSYFISSIVSLQALLQLLTTIFTVKFERECIGQKKPRD